jgi:hypothetical protein
MFIEMVEKLFCDLRDRKNNFADKKSNLNPLLFLK